MNNRLQTKIMDFTVQNLIELEFTGIRPRLVNLQPGIYSDFRDALIDYINQDQDETRGWTRVIIGIFLSNSMSPKYCKAGLDELIKNLNVAPVKKLKLPAIQSDLEKIIGAIINTTRPELIEKEAINPVILDTVGASGEVPAKLAAKARKLKRMLKRLEKQGRAA